MARKIKRERAWKSQPSKTNLAFSQCWPLAIPTWITWDREVHWFKLNFVGFLTRRPIIILNFSRKGAHMKEI
jgi:hypothetical protein